MNTKTLSIRSRQLLAGLALTGLAALGAAPAMAQNLVVNGDFTQYTAPTALNPSTGLPYTSFNTHSPIGADGGSLIGWTQSNATTNNSQWNGGNFGVLMSGNDNDTMYGTSATSTNNCCYLTWSKATVQAAYDANHAYADPSVANNTWDGRGPNGANFWTTTSNYYSAALSQTINLQKNQQYTLSFAWAAGQSVNGAGTGWGGWNVAIGNQPVQVVKSADLGQSQFSGWSSYSYTFTANTTGLATLTFSPTGAAPQMDLLSSISVTAVPEPTTMLLFGLGLGALMLYRRRTRQ